MENEAAGEEDQELGGGLRWLGDLHTVRAEAVFQGERVGVAEDCELGGRDRERGPERVSPVGFGGIWLCVWWELLENFQQRGDVMKFTLKITLLF